ncbi:hypothetical protein GCM10027449_11230 [Sinomonas notoginsengisoli]|uniref:thermonuclease family protein n=1 Tax=Sinomonas notoginsengisoli TaxID=1457311 RepID=UPI001F3F3A35|nr:thermonuclease family protein [Sinomonas notoginsengisoli]
MQAKIVRVVDGDTFEAEYSGQKKTVRLLNVDTPETKHPNKIVQCLGPEATRFLEGKLPTGKTVTLRFDEEKTDKYDRALAATFVGDELVNASIARAGLGIAMSISPNTKYFSEVKAAQEEAQAKKAGLFQDTLACSPETVAQDQVTALTAITDPAANASSADISASAAALLTTISGARAGTDILNGAQNAVLISAIGSTRLSAATSRVTEALARADGRHKALTERAASVKAEEERKAAEARAAEEQRKAEEAAAKAAEEARAKAAAEAEAAARAQADAARNRAQPAPSQQNPYPGYYGPRCYAPGGQTWTPCPEKAPGYGEAPTQSNPYPGYVGPRCYAPGGKSWTPCPEKARK